MAYFGHDANEPAVRRRATAFRRAGVDVMGFMPHRGDFTKPEWSHVDLGQTRDNDYLQRVTLVYSGARRALNYPDMFRRADIFLARNLDMLALAARVRRKLGLDVPLVYECLDIHHRLTGPSRPARMLRRLEARLLEQCALVMISSPRFAEAHFETHYPGKCRFHLVENRLIEGDAFAARPAPRAAAPEGPLRIGWFGNLRCRRSLDLLKSLANRFPDDLRIILRGYPAPGVFPDFEAEFAGQPNIVFHGRYKAPGDLEAIYGEVDLIWAGDWYEAGANSMWLLPNRIYEGGYFATPALAPAGTQVAQWLTERGGGFILDDPIDETLGTLVGELIENRQPIENRRDHLLGLPRSTYVESPQAVADLIAAARGMAVS
ncbi:hypothetical protein [Marinibacterium sp. SX1]|uniref:hypothetical protein n=1 Tax=Marinibacterium sp. SX1 TaxID=3388424 RepID=UPI003D166D36